MTRKLVINDPAFQGFLERVEPWHGWNYIALCW